MSGEGLASLGQIFVQVLAPILMMVGAGYLLRSLLTIEVRSISRIVFYILAPCLIYSSLVYLEFDRSVTQHSLLFAALDMAVMFGLATSLARRWHYQGHMAHAFVVTSILLNNGNYGLPLNLFAFGEQGFSYALILFTFNSLVGTTLSVYLFARGENGGKVALQRTLQTPVVWATLLGLVSRQTGVVPTGAIMEMITDTGHAAIPVFLIVLGMSLAQTSRRAHLQSVSRLAVLRMLGGPAVAVVLAKLVGLGGVARSVAILQGSMPTAVNSIVLSNEFEAAPDFVAGAVFATTVVSMVTLPALLLWLG
ncbi:MAG: AEC family transporter [Chloroflexi bacterium]|nr:AEC family transporter [Chloroflexota bacterium]